MVETSSTGAFDALAYRRALGGFGTGVALVAAYDREGRAHGLIINSLTSVSLSPPIILWCLADTCGGFEIFTGCEAFSINILGSDAEEVARRFSSQGEKLIPDELTETLATGAPILSAAVASLDCRVHSHQTVGDHEVIFGDVTAYRTSPEASALGFFRGRYVTLSLGE